MTKHPAFIAFAVLLIASLACSQSNTPPTPDQNAVNTSIAQSISARQTEAVLKNPPTATITAVPELPTATLEPTFTPMPDFTSTPLTPLLTVSKDTNCRTGPGVLYEKVGYVLAGEVTEALARDPKAEYWLVRNLDDGPATCWVWGEYAEVTGNIYTLYIYTPEPLPKVLNVSVGGVRECDSTWRVNFSLTNTSGTAFQSISIIMTDLNNTTTTSVNSNDFVHNESCAPVVVDKLDTGETVTVFSPGLSYSPKGHNFSAKINVCTDINQAGICISEDVSFQP